MDTLKTYIKMCEQIEEIQKHQPEAWDYYYLYNDREDKEEVLVLSGYTTDSGFYGPGVSNVGLDLDGYKLLCWLPRQDQLQEMMGGEGLLGGEVQLIWEYMRSFRGKEGWRPETWEQLWLAFVMKEKYGEVWNGTNWMKE